MTITMAFTVTTHTPSFLYTSSSSSSLSLTVGKTSCLCSFSNPAIAIPKNAIFQQVKCTPQLGFTPFSLWNGFKQTGFSILRPSLKTGKKGRSKGKVVYASLFGVGAPEVLVIGVVALLVFGPKGLAEVARNLGKTLREFQPTIRELQEVSREFKSTLEREIGLDDPTPQKSTSDSTKPKSEDAPTDSETKIEPNGSSGNEEDDRLKVRAESFLGALAQIQKEQDEEEERRRLEREKQEAEKQERDSSQEQTESQTPSQDAAEALDDSEKASSSVDNPDNDALQEASSVTSASGNPENNASIPTAIDSPENNRPQEAASVTTASDIPENSASVATATDNTENNVLQEATTMAPTSAATKTGSET